MLEAKVMVKEKIPIPARVIKNLSLKDGMVIEGIVEKGKLLILKKGERTKKVLQFAGIWENEEVDKIFVKIRKDWDKWQKNLHV
ncbi:MAG: hypothetical protein NTU69_11420 [Proteobacteria bacterium]|jgi:bifunctional DNA-binding transcriptional regulator/antitoxin component of YhaV-PrlF toxin-antitoxin module|nr:hypothetical protein [Pseudomonadota bacterium]